MRRGAPALRALRPALGKPRTVNVSALIGYDGFFAVVLAAWWQLRQSANLLPHLRKGPSSFHFSPANSFVSWVMTAVTVQTLLSLGIRRRVGRPGAPENGQRRRTVGTPAGTPTVPTRAVSRSDREGRVASTAPIPMPTGWGPTGRSTPPHTPPLTLRPPATSTSGSVPDPIRQPVVEPPTFPFPAIKGRSDGPPPDAPNGSGRPNEPATVPSTEPPTRPALRPAAPRRGSV